MFPLFKGPFRHGDWVCLRAPYGGLIAGAIGTILEVYWANELCSVDFTDDTTVILPWRFLEAAEAPPREMS